LNFGVWEKKKNSDILPKKSIHGFILLVGPECCNKEKFLQDTCSNYTITTQGHSRNKYSLAASRHGNPKKWFGGSKLNQKMVTNHGHDSTYETQARDPIWIKCPMIQLFDVLENQPLPANFITYNWKIWRLKIIKILGLL